jgi:hypothetical protein
MIEATSIWPDGSFNGVEVLWGVVIACLCVLVVYARNRMVEQEQQALSAPAEERTPSQQRLACMGSAVDDLLRADAFAWPKE